MAYYWNINSSNYQNCFLTIFEYRTASARQHLYQLPLLHDNTVQQYSCHCCTTTLFSSTAATALLHLHTFCDNSLAVWTNSYVTNFNNVTNFNKRKNKCYFTMFFTTADLMASNCAIPISIISRIVIELEPSHEYGAGHQNAVGGGDSNYSLLFRCINICWKVTFYWSYCMTVHFCPLGTSHLS